jgi:hypothetical protein
MALSEQQAIRRLWDYGHFSNPAKPDTFNVQEIDLAKLNLSHPIVKEAIQSYQDFNAIQGDTFSLDHHSRPMIHDGEIGPATLELLEAARCAVPDYRREPLPAVGTGGWSRCHGIGNFHAATVYINRSTMPSFLVPVWDQVWANTVAAYDEIGLHFIATDDAQNHNTSLTWVQPDGGWIGLALIGRNQSCASKIWSRYDRNYKGGSSPASIVTQWTSLVKHELGHNCGMEHSRGGVMNPSIVNGLPVSWKGDPSESLLRRWVGGEAIPDSTPDPDDPVPNPPGGTDVTASGTVTFSFPGGKRNFILIPRPEV